MAQVSTGTSFTNAGLNDFDNRFSGRTGLMQVLIRDNRGADTDISPYNADFSVKWSPLAADGTLRDDLLAWKRNPANGLWELNSDENEGFHIIGAFGEGEGPSMKPSIDTDDQMIEQSNWPYDSDVTKQDEPFSFTGIEIHRPTMRRLRHNLRLNAANGDVITETPGGENQTWGTAVDLNPIDRQVLLVYARNRNGKTLIDVVGYSLCRLSDIGESKRGKKDNGASQLTYRPLPDPYFMVKQEDENGDRTLVPGIKNEWVDGSLWRSLGVPTPATYTVDLGSPSAGTFTLTFRGNTTATIAYGAASSAVKSALVALDDGFGSSDWTVTGSSGGPYTVTTPGGALTGDGSGLTDGDFSITPV